MSYASYQHESAYIAQGIPARHIHLFTISKIKVALVLFWQTGTTGKGKGREREESERSSL